ncbi:hypothetical protein ACFFQF_25775 [Haladaptatus pallidirubidus]
MTEADSSDEEFQPCANCGNWSISPTIIRRSSSNTARLPTT